MDNLTYEQLEPILQSLLLIASLATAGMAGATATYSRLYYNQHVWFKMANVALFLQAVLVGRAALEPLATSPLPVVLALVSYLMLRSKSAQVSHEMMTKPEDESSL